MGRDTKNWNSVWDVMPEFMVSGNRTIEVNECLFFYSQTHSFLDWRFIC